MKLFPLYFSIALGMTHLAAKAQAGTIAACEFKKPADGDLSGAKAVVDKLKAECIPRIARVNACLVRSRLLLENIRDLSNIFIISDKSKPLMVDAAAKGSFDRNALDMSLWANFAALEQDYQSSLGEIDGLVSKFKDGTTDKTKLQDYIAELDRGYTLSSNTLASLSLKESALLNYIEQATNALELSADSTKPEIQWLASDACKDADLMPVLALTKGTVEKIVQRIDTIHSFIVEARNAREHLIQYAYAATRKDLEDRYRNQAMQDLATLGGKIDTVLHVNRIAVAFDLWTGALASDNDRSMVEFNWLQYEASQRMRAIELVTAQDFREQMLLASESFPEVAAPYLPKLENVIKGMQASIDRVQATGWAGFRVRQKFMAGKMLEIASKYSPLCVANLQAFLAQVDGVTSIEQNRVSEAIYKAAIVSCWVKK